MQQSRRKTAAGLTVTGFVFYIFSPNNTPKSDPGLYLRPLSNEFCIFPEKFTYMPFSVHCVLLELSMIEKFILHTSWFGDGDEAGAVCANEIRRVKSFTFLNANEMTFLIFSQKMVLNYS